MRIPKALSDLFGALGPLVARVTIAAVFIPAGLGKFGHMEKTIEYFQSLGVPGASIQAPFVAGVELIGGILVLFGLGTRFISAALIGIMAVAIRTAKWEDFAGWDGLIEVSEFLYIVILFALVAGGAGLVSLDALWRRFRR